MIGSSPCQSIHLKSPTHRYLVDQQDRPFLVHGDTAWSMMTAATKEEAEEYLVNRRLKGFNSTIVDLIEHKFNGPVNRDGEGPFQVPGDFPPRMKNTSSMRTG